MEFGIRVNTSNTQLLFVALLESASLKTFVSVLLLVQKASYLITRFCVQSCGNVLQEVATSSALCDMLAQLVARVAMWQNTSFELECNNPDPHYAG